MNKNFQSRFTQHQNEIRTRSQEVRKQALRMQTVAILGIIISGIAGSIALGTLIFVGYKILNHFGIL